MNDMTRDREVRAAFPLEPASPAELGFHEPALARLESKGFVASSMGAATAERGGKAKRLYGVTPLGMRTARELHRVRQKIWTAITAGRHQ